MYLQELAQVLDSPDKVVGTPPEGTCQQLHALYVECLAVTVLFVAQTTFHFLIDMALGMVMWCRGITP